MESVPARYYKLHVGKCRLNIRRVHVHMVAFPKVSDSRPWKRQDRGSRNDALENRRD